MRLKANRMLGALLLPMMVFAACNNDVDEESISTRTEFKFSSVLEELQTTRAAGTAWNADDYVGVYMIKAGTSLSEENIVAGAANKKYVTASGDGNFQAYNEDQTIYYPEDGTKVDFIACYPYKENLSGFSYPINLADQSDQPAIDLLYSNNATQMDLNSKDSLHFSHRLTRMVLDIKSVDGNENLEGLAVKLNGFKSTGSFSLVDGSLTMAEESKSEIGAKVSVAENGSAVAEIILLPESDLSGATIEFSLPSAEKPYVHKIPEGQDLSSGTQFSYDVQLDNTGGENKVIVLGSSITDWNQQDGGKIEVDFDSENEGTDPTPEPDPTPDPTPDPAPETATVFVETFGESVSRIGKYWPSVDSFTGWDNSSFQYSDPVMEGDYSNANIRTTSTLNPHIWFAANKNSQLKIEGFVTTGTTFTLSYLIAANVSANQNEIKVYCGESEMTVPAKAIPTMNVYQKVEISGIPAGFTSITFSSEAAINTAGFRVDDITLVRE